MYIEYIYVRVKLGREKKKKKHQRLELLPLSLSFCNNILFFSLRPLFIVIAGPFAVARAGGPDGFSDEISLADPADRGAW